MLLDLCTIPQVSNKVLPFENKKGKKEKEKRQKGKKKNKAIIKSKMKF